MKQKNKKIKIICYQYLVFKIVDIKVIVQK